MVAVKTRTLADLYKIGETFTLSDGAGDDVSVYLQKMNPVEVDTAIRKANAKRARLLMMSRDKDSEEYLNLVNDVLDFSHEDLIEYAVQDELGRRAEAIENEWVNGTDSPWAKDEYLQSLFDAWNEPGVQERFFVGEDDEPDPESVKIYNELERYAQELNVEMDKHRKFLHEEFEGKSLEKLTEQTVERLAKVQGDIEWMIEYRKCEIWLSVRKSEKDRSRYFSSRQDVDELDQKTMERLIDALTSLSVEVDQGKDLEETEVSSN